jgi:glucokinase
MILGIDIGGTSTKLGLVKDGKVIRHGRIPTAGTDENVFADAIADEARRMSEAPGEITAIGIGAPNGNQNSGCIELSANLPWKGIVPLAKMLSDRLGKRCVLGNDANAAGLGEWRYGAGRGCTDLLVVTLGTGLGSGFIVNSQLLIGTFGNAGELGHITLVIDGRECGCGRKGCLETYTNIQGIRRTFLEQGGDEKILKEEGVLPVANALKAGDPIALKAFDLTARWLAIGLANAIAITTPQRIVLFGGIARNGELLMGPLRKYFEPSMMNVFQGKVDLCLSELPEDDAGILGAAALTTL